MVILAVLQVITSPGSHQTSPLAIAAISTI